MANDTPDLESIVKVARKFSRPYRIDRGRGFRLKDIDPGDTAHLGAEDKPRAQEALAIGRNALSDRYGGSVGPSWKCGSGSS